MSELRRAELYSLLGDLPPRDAPIDVAVQWVEQRERYTVEKLLLGLNGIEPVPAYFVRPKGTSGKLPTALYNHPHGAKYHIGKEDLLISRGGKLPWGEELVNMGCNVLCMDMWAFGERSTRCEMDIFKEMLWKGQVMWGMMVFDTLRGFDYLLTRDDVDASRIATLGLSMGSTMAWYLAALEPRIKVCADICCLTEFDELIKTDGLQYHGIYYYVPSLLKHFTAASINALIAPRAHISVAGVQDPLTPPKGLDIIDEELKRVYAAAGAPENWLLKRYDVGHVETPEMRADVVAFLKKKL
ncbi:MAG: alpha/beta hydrolase family protein [Bdellovibrionales bacterium]